MSKFSTFLSTSILLFAGIASAQSGFRYFDVTDTAAPPKLLSLTGIYANIGNKTLITDAVRFDVNSPLWSDASAKLRWILLKRGTSVGYREKDDYWDYPDSAVFIKQFAIDTVPGDSTSRRIWETRILVNRKEHPQGDTALPIADHWYGFSYKWRKDGSDADLVPGDEGSNDTIRVWPKGRNQPAAWKKWHFPSRQECNRCHVPTLAMTQARSVLGFFTAQLNRPYFRGNGNQLDTLFARGVLRGTKSIWAQSPRWYGVKDSAAPGATVENRARAYIAANCSGCHGARGNANQASAFVAFIYDFHDGAGEDWRYKRVRRGDYVKDAAPTTVDPGLVVPRYPQKSLLLYRQAQRNGTPGDFAPNAAEMPPLASFEPNTEALDLITRWILEMDTTQVSIRPGAHGFAGFRDAALRDRVFHLPAELIAAGGTSLVVTMTGLDGRSWTLRTLGDGRYALPSGASRGVYAFRAGGRVFLRNLLE